MVPFNSAVCFDGRHNDLHFALPVSRLTIPSSLGSKSTKKRPQQGASFWIYTNIMWFPRMAPTRPSTTTRSTPPDTVTVALMADRLDLLVGRLALRIGRLAWWIKACCFALIAVFVLLRTLIVPCKPAIIYDETIQMMISKSQRAS